MTADESHSAHATHEHAPPRPDLPDGPLSHYQKLEIAVRELLIEKGIVTAGEIREAIETIDAIEPAMGARVVARAWTDPGFKSRLLQNAADACQELGYDVGPTKLVVLENTERVHNVVVCTLCSCYPRRLLGLPPDWYKSRAYRSRVVREPRAVLREFGTELPDDVALRVHDSSADMRYLVLPQRPEHTENLSEEALAALVTRDAMIGVSRCRTP